jgi:CYTH domain-containing protein
MVFVIPETATLITSNGIDRRKMDGPKQVAMYEEAILDMQLSFEETYERAVMQIFPARKKVLLLDRGAMDIKAFMPRGAFNEMLRRKGLGEARLRDRYHGVIHLVTAAEGAAAHYTRGNNAARMETAEEAASIDRKIREAWLGHPRLRIIDNRTDFEGKINRTFSEIMQLLGMPAPRPSMERYIIDAPDRDLLPAHQTVEIEQLYVRTKNRGEEIGIRRRGRDGSYLYFLTRTRKTDPPVEEEELITEEHYESLKRLKDPGADPLTKERVSFFWRDQHIEIDNYKGRYDGLSILQAAQCEAPGDRAPVQLPPFATVRKNITRDRSFSEKRMATKKKTGTAAPHLP